MKTVLVIDDELHLRELLHDMLSDLGYQVTLAESRDSALALLQPRPDFVLMDYQMPGLSAQDFCVALSARSLISRTIMMSGNVERDMAAALGLSYFLAKPFKQTELVQALNDCDLGINKLP